MNEIEAIAYFEQLIKYFEDKEGEPYWSKVHNSMSRQMITVALEALREQAERSADGHKNSAHPDKHNRAGTGKNIHRNYTTRKEMCQIESY